MRAVMLDGRSGTVETANLRPTQTDGTHFESTDRGTHINLLKRHQITEVIATLHYLPDVFATTFKMERFWRTNDLCRGETSP